MKLKRLSINLCYIMEVLMMKREYWGIPTLEGIMQASIGDYIIKGVQGEYYPCKPDIFKITYDEV